MQNFRALGAPPPDPRASGGWGLRPQTPKPAPPHCEFLTMRLTVANVNQQYQPDRSNKKILSNLH